ncbi:helix-turn-helix domain-containing protein [Candidatus Parcubacteria bacterium]|nr:helix-turn-helix domain-containing protein [Candidatus Parcubacteria bacterium]
MATIKEKKFNIIKEYYDSGLSAKDIAEKLGVSIDAVYYFFRKYKIKRRNRSEVRNLIYKKQKPSFKLKTNLSEEEKKLKVAGVMLYWGEGSKWSGEKIIDFANSDIEMIKVFLNFLRIICSVKEKKLRVYLYCYANQNPQFLMKHWSKITNISIKQFTKPYIRKDYDKNKIGKMKYGLIHVRYADKKLLNLIRSLIKEYIVKLT